jgi:hypothetical protein
MGAEKRPFEFNLNDRTWTGCESLHIRSGSTAQWIERRSAELRPPVHVQEDLPADCFVKVP